MLVGSNDPTGHIGGYLAHPGWDGYAILRRRIGGEQEWEQIPGAAVTLAGAPDGALFAILADGTILSRA